MSRSVSRFFSTRCHFVLDLSLRLANDFTNSCPDVLNSLFAIQFGPHLVILMDKSLKFTLETVVLVIQHGNVTIKGSDLLLENSLISLHLLIVCLEAFNLILKLLLFLRDFVYSHDEFRLSHLILLTFNIFKLITLQKLLLCILVLFVLIIKILKFAIKLIKLVFEVLNRGISVT